MVYFFSSRRRHTRFDCDWSSLICFFFPSRRRHTRFDCDWSSDVCSSDLAAGRLLPEVSAELSGEFSPSSLTKPMIAPIVRAALRQSMQLLGHAFIVGETIDAALSRGRAEPGLALCSLDLKSTRLNSSHSQISYA